MAQIMGIINLTEDSFYAPSRTGADKAVERAGAMLREGADILDFGACSTRPGSTPPSPEEEGRRLVSALKEVKAAFPQAQVSVDTYRAEVVERVYDAIGPFLVNDVSAGTLDPEMLPLAGRLELPYVAMHMRGTPETMQRFTDYADVVEEVKTFFRTFSQKAGDNGITDWILDPGFGFAKTLEQNYTLLGRLEELKELGRPVLVGISRKSMIYRMLEITPEEAGTPTQVLNYVALEKGADILRVHDVADTRRTMRIYSMMYTSSPGAANL
ncbi:MAG: dihydropteroate synthase [Bacteroidales bacterium]|nr:dihydropteroate synthase [Bacteroidales bacterium]